MATTQQKNNSSADADENVDREKKCPLLLRVFLNTNGRHYHVSEYGRGNLPSKEVQIYTWMDATLKELAGLIKEVNTEARRPGTRFNFALVFPDIRNPTYRMREIGSTINGRKDSDDSKTLAQSRFQIGDFLSVAISANNSQPEDRTRADRLGSNSARTRFNGDRDYYAERKERSRPF
ncbi:Histone deacetylase complex subunit SAP18 [Sarcoptes scabiei]|uniref:18 kDa Sin3-associated polypeptide n=1 Tax=Sarcoptes scabiei TaxID=52283 RepID=A0A132AD61_SARSC|nr:Histone deacetylase complex subunit SAP18 [Sarcoptes scabiei]KPM08400.1 histone deacetylase complex subunit SAP18-like protein [Sarcoptes scabiei]